MNNGDYIKTLRDDIPEQFKGKPNIEAFHAALARQLSALYAFFAELNTLRRLQNAAGVQLDGIGDIVAMSRMDALALSNLANQNIPMDDETYGSYLKWKIALNTSNCTHKDRHNALKLFWDKTPIYYSEDPLHPATIFLKVPVSISESESAVFRIASMIKAAGVALLFVFTGDIYETTDCHAGAEVDWIKEFIIGDQTEIQTDAADYAAGAAYDSIWENNSDGDEKIQTDATDYTVGAAYETIKEKYKDD